MGCDIHLFAEIGRQVGRPYEDLSDGQFRIAPDYRLFSALAGVRSEVGEKPLFPPRGIPTDVSQEVSGRYFSPVLTHDQAETWRVSDWLTADEAERHVHAGQSEWISEGTTPPLVVIDDACVSSPDWHTPSWLTVDEVHACLAHLACSLDDTPVEFQCLVRYLADIARRQNTTGRIVFWFDN